MGGATWKKKMAQYKCPALRCWCHCRSFDQCVVADATMGLFKCLFGVAVIVILACDVAARRQWMPPVEKPQSQRPVEQTPDLPPIDPFEKCQVEEGQKISCGPQDVTVEECLKINCCSDGSQCFYGKGGGCLVPLVALPLRQPESMPCFPLFQRLCSVPAMASLWWLWLGTLPGHTLTWIQSACLKLTTPPAPLLTSTRRLPSSSSL